MNDTAYSATILTGFFRDPPANSLTHPPTGIRVDDGLTRTGTVGVGHQNAPKLAYICGSVLSEDIRSRASTRAHTP